MLQTSRASDVSLEELLAFERLLFDLSARFANVAGEQVVAEIEIALKQLIEFLDFDRSSFAEFTDEGKANFICTVLSLRWKLRGASLHHAMSAAYRTCLLLAQSGHHKNVSTNEPEAGLDRFELYVTSGDEDRVALHTAPRPKDALLHL